MKVFALCALLLVAASATDAVTNFTFDGPTFVDAMLQSTLGWAYPPSFQTCMTNLKTSAESYAAFWETFENFSYNTMMSSGQGIVTMWAASPRCYYATNIVATFGAGVAYVMVDEILSVLDLGILAWIAFAGYEVVAYYGSLVFDWAVLYMDAMQVFHGTYDSTTLGYIAGFFARGIFSSVI